MNVNTYDATPLYEGTVSGGRKMRTLRDEDGDLWFEVAPDRFVYTPEQTRDAAKEDYGSDGFTAVMSLEFFEDTDYTFV